MKSKKQIVTFKVDDSLVEAMKGIENRSDFIRSAVLAALDSVCPLCKGSGILSPAQRVHWKDFEEGHTFEECEECREMVLVCANRQNKDCSEKKRS